MRETLGTEEYWAELIKFQTSSISRRRGIYTSPGTGHAQNQQLCSALQSSLFYNALALFSSGRPVESVVEMGRASVIDLLPKYIADFPPGTKDGVPPFNTSQIHRFFATMVLCGSSKLESGGVFEALDLFGVTPTFNDTPDRIWTIYRNKLLGEDQPLPKTIQWPEAYAPLARAMDPELPDAARPTYLRKFLDGWYKEMSSEVAAQTTWGDNLGPESEYVGYWCLEAAGAAVLLGIDDTNLADHPYYPKDWADWARGRG